MQTCWTHKIISSSCSWTLSHNVIAAIAILRVILLICILNYLEKYELSLPFLHLSTATKWVTDIARGRRRNEHTRRVTPMTLSRWTWTYANIHEVMSFREIQGVNSPEGRWACPWPPSFMFYVMNKLGNNGKNFSSVKFCYDKFVASQSQNPQSSSESWSCDQVSRLGW